MQHNFALLRQFQFLSKIFALTTFVLAGCSDEQDEIVPLPQNTLEAHAGDNHTVLVNTELILDASGSKSANQLPVEYKWTLKQKPVGSIAGITQANAKQSSFTPDKTGIYTITLTISQGSISDTDDVRVVATASDDPNEPQTIFIENDIITDRVLVDVFTDANTPDYIVTKDVRVSAALTVQPGVIIEFEQDRGLQVMHGGTLIADGTAAQPITFTGIQKQKGYWKGLLIATNSPNKIQYAIIEYGGSSEYPESPRANISVPGDAISGSVLRITNSTIRYSGSYGLYVGGMSSIPELEEVSFSDNAGTAIYSSPNNLSHIDPYTIFSGNGFNGVETGGILNEGNSVSWHSLINGAYRITSDLTIATDLEIISGSVFKMSKNVLITVSYNGMLVANGTADANTIFEGESTVAENGWRGILIQSGRENSLTNTIIRNGGNNVMPGMTDVRSSIGVATGANASITNSLVEKSGGWGIALEAGSYYNEDIHTSNNFIATAQGSVKFPVRPQPVNITGEWVEYFSLQTNGPINENFYNRQSGVWFEGAENPWAMNPNTAFGLKVDASGNYVWTIAVAHSPMTECFTYSAEYFTGQVTADGAYLNFVEEFWRSKYFNSCDAEGSMDLEIEPGQMNLPYEVTQEYNPVTGATYSVLSIVSSGEVFKLYKR